MSVDLSPITWPSGDLTQRRAIFVYEAARVQAQAVFAPIVPEPWHQRDEAFRAQFLNVVDMMCSEDRKTSPAELQFREQIRDAVFVALCEIARQWIVPDPERTLQPKDDAT